MQLWYRTPARTNHVGWEEEALPLGNGALGCKVFGGTETERIQLNEKSLWSGSTLGHSGNSNGNAPGDRGESLRYLQQLLREGKAEEAKEQMVRLQGDDSGLGKYQTLGDLYLEDMLPAESDYSRGLDLEQAVAWTRFVTGSGPVERTCFASYPAGVIVLHQTGADLHVRLRFEPGQPDASVTADDRTLFFAGQVPEPEHTGLFWVFGCRADADGELTVQNGQMEISHASQFTLYLTAETDYGWNFPAYRNGKTPDELAKNAAARLESAAKKGYSALLQEHLADYQPLWNRARLQLEEDPDVRGEIRGLDTAGLYEAYRTGRDSRTLEQLLFAFGRYLLLTSSRAGSLPANLQGVWNDTNTPPWQSDYHLNINLQMNYWPALPTGLPEVMQPLFDYVNHCLIEPGRHTAYAFTGVGDPEARRPDGWMAHTQNNPFGHTGPGGNWCWGWAPTVGAFLLQNTYEYYRFTGDLSKLEREIYPAMEEAARMWNRLLVERDGEWIVTPCFSPEHGPVTEGNTFDQTMVWQLLSDTLEAADALISGGRAAAVDSPLIGELRAKLPRIIPCHIGAWGQIQEWREEDTWKNRGFDDMRVQPQHRHLSQLMGLYPGHFMDELGEEWKAASRVSLLDRGESGPGWSLALRIGLWARLHSGDDCHRYLQNLIRENVYGNLWSFHTAWGPCETRGLYQIDGNFGLTAGIAEMLLSSWKGVVRVLPALPEAWKRGGRFTGLRARGGYAVDAEWSEGRVTRLAVTAPREGSLLLAFGGSIRQVSLQAGVNEIDCSD